MGSANRGGRVAPWAPCQNLTQIPDRCPAHLGGPLPQPQPLSSVLWNFLPQIFFFFLSPHLFPFPREVLMYLKGLGSLVLNQVSSIRFIFVSLCHMRLEWLSDISLWQTLGTAILILVFNQLSSQT